MAFIVDEVARPLALDLLVCLDQQVDMLEKPPKRRMLRSGNITNFLVSLTKNECCEGLAWVRVAGIAPSSTANWPNADVVPPRGCGVQRFAVQLEMGIVRCAPVADGRTLPDEDIWNVSAIDVLNDFAAMDRARCCFQDIEPDRLTLVGSWEPLAVQGMCVGGIMTLTAAASPCNCVDLDSPGSPNSPT